MTLLILAALILCAACIYANTLRKSLGDQLSGDIADCDERVHSMGDKR